jgi:hypothetical protein
VGVTDNGIAVGELGVAVEGTGVRVGLGCTYGVDSAICVVVGGMGVTVVDGLQPTISAKARINIILVK